MLRSFYRQTIRWKHNIMELAGCIPVIAGSILVIHSTCTCAKMERRALCSYFGVDNIFNRYNSYFSNVPSYSSQNRFELASSGRLMKLTFTWNFNHGKKSGAVTVEKKSASERSRIEGK